MKRNGAWVSRTLRCTGVICSIAAVAPGALRSQEVPADAAVQNQWFTGSLEAPSPALPKAGMLAIEPYFIDTSNTGAYNDDLRHYFVADNTRQVESVTVFKYAITDRLSIEALPTVSRSWNTQTAYTGLGDLPTELEYRFNDENSRTGAPSVTAALGITLPTGQYQRLRNPLDGQGSGAYMAKEGLLFQSLFDGPDHHPIRLRFYAAAYEALRNVTLRDISVYGTSSGFQGHVAPGIAEEAGIGGGIGLDQSWVLALDLVGNHGAGFDLRGRDTDGLVDFRGANSSSVSVAPAVEYNWSGSMGIIAGVEFSAAGRNTPSYIAPQIALAMAF